MNDIDNFEFSKIYSDDGYKYLAFQLKDVRNTNPIKYYKDYFSHSFKRKFYEVYSKEYYYCTETLGLHPSHFELKARREAQYRAKQKIREALKAKVPTSFKAIFNVSKKRQQESAIKTLQLSSKLLLTCIFFAYQEHSFNFSLYTHNFDHPTIKNTKMPLLAHLENDRVYKVGNTPYSDGQIKQNIQQKKRRVINWMEKGNEWHCFFITYRSLRGEESWKGGQPHYHYMSNKFGIPKARVLQELSSEEYNLGSLPHVDLIDWNED